MKKRMIRYVLAGTLSLTLAMSTQAQHYVVVAPTHAPMVRPPMPHPGYIWMPEEWRWSGGRYVWVPGRWIAAPYHGAVWIPGSWRRGPHGYYWVGGHWRARY